VDGVSSQRLGDRAAALQRLAQVGAHIATSGTHQYDHLRTYSLCFPAKPSPWWSAITHPYTCSVCRNDSLPDDGQHESSILQSHQFLVQRRETRAIAPHVMRCIISAVQFAVRYIWNHLFGSVRKVYAVLSAHSWTKINSINVICEILWETSTVSSE